MGCASSKLDDLQAVKLCRERCAFLDEAIHQRYLLSEAHVAYIESLKGVGLSLHRFFGQDVGHFTGGPPSPVVKLPEKKKGDGEPPRAHHSHSNSGSHLQFNSDSEDDDSVSESLHHHLDDSPPVQHPYDHLSYPDHETLGSYQGGYMNINYMRNKATPSVVYEQRPMSPENVRMAEYSYPHSDQNPAYNSYSNYGGYFGNSYGYGQPQVPVPASSVASTSKQQVPPPPPPSSRGSAWEFLNPFEISEQYYPQYTPSRNSKDLREEEGIPDLEEEDYQPEIVKEVHEDKKFVDVGGSNYSKAVAGDEDGQSKGNDSDSIYHGRPSSSTEGDAVEYEVHMVDKKVVNKEDTSGDRTNVAPFKARGGFRDDSEVVKEIQIQFERASDSVNDLANILEVGKHPHSRKHKVYQASSKMFNVITPSLSVVSSQPSTSKSVEPPSIEMADPAHLDIDGDLGMRSRNLSSTLQELFLWEKKLYEEVKVEEKMRILHERKCRKLKHLDERGADFHKVDATRSLVRSLSTKIRIAIQVVDKISVKINKLRDEKLWPQLNEFIKGLSKMWKSMLECHQSQCRAIGEAKRLDFVASGKHLSEARLEATSQLERELIKWTSRFFYWVSAQKGYVRAMNEWLLKCLLYVPEETPDGIVPFSPGRIGAPPVFIICNQWSQALERISEKEVLDSMLEFQTCVYQMWERDKLEMRQRMMVSKDTERKVKDLEREDQKIHKEIQVLGKQMILAFGASETGPVVHQRDTSKNNSLQVSLLHIFEAMERFAASSLKSYEELLQRIEEDRLAP